MGWDVVEIGLRHNLPVDNPFATAKEVARRMGQNIRLVYRNEYEYDREKNVVKGTNDDNFIELGKFGINNTKEYLRMIISNYQTHHIEEPFELYEIEDDNENFDIRIFKETVDLDVNVEGRWYWWEKAFHLPNSQNQEWLSHYRMCIYHQARMFGCDEVIICSDQGPAMTIYDNLNYSANQLKEYAHSFQYLSDNNWLEASEKEDWRRKAKHIMFSSYFKNQLYLSDDDFVEVIYDDFSDIRE